MEYVIVLPILISVLIGVLLLISSFVSHTREKSKAFISDNFKYTGVVSLITLFVCVAITLYVAWFGPDDIVLFSLVDDIPIHFHIDDLGRLFVTVTSIVWLMVCVYAIKYMKHEGEERRFYGCYLIVYGVLVALDFAGNLITFYLLYELMTITSVVMVLHKGTKEAIMAGLKYLFYSMAGAYCALFGMFVVYQHCHHLNFTAGANLNEVLASENREIMLVAVFFMLLGFGTKGGMLPFHAWLPTAHPVAPSPASAVLSAIIVKSGVLGVIRTVYYVVGPDFIRGSWVQYAWIGFALTTIFMGSMLAYREKVFKKRLAYSTVSQVSYIFFGLALLDPVAMTGSLVHVVGHALIKCSLFLSAGLFAFKTGKTHVDDFIGIGKTMKVTLMAYTLGALGLIGIPPTVGFISKWYFASGALKADLNVVSILGIVVLLISALLTAGYLLPITIRGFFPGKDVQIEEKEEKLDSMSGVIFIMAILALLIGILPNPIIDFAREIVATLF
ncbi:MAG: proton-conducting membrane transporter [Lachnospiraceae bacterium]|nr:proton-conducting membrane transporter [Lachnospiraceae bacterium]